jgi:transposase
MAADMGSWRGVSGWLKARVPAKGEITLDELVAELAQTPGIAGHRSTVWRVLRGLGLTHKRMARPVCKRVEAGSFRSCTNVSGIAVNQ